MFSTKKDVDRYAQDVLRRVKNERERNMRCYNIAVQYYKVRDFDSTRRYVCMYLAFKDDSASAHKLLGQALEGLKQKEKALAQYRRSVELEANQPELILKICELITDQDVHVDMEKARYWCDRAADLFPHHPVVFRLKERLLTNGTSNSTAAHYSKEFEDLISSELKSRPVDVNVHVRQLKLYMDTGRTQAAYAHAQEIEAKKLFAHEIQWYDYLTTLYKTYYDKNLPEVSDCEFFVNWTMVNERYVMLCLAENQTSPPKSITECGSAIYRFDEVLHKSYALLGNSKLYGQVSLSIKRFADFLEHMSAQLCLHLATFIFKKAKNEQGNWNEATRSAAPLLLFALVLAPPSEQQNMGGTPLKLLEREPLKNLPQWTMAAYHRHCQAGHVIVSLAKETQRQQFVDKVLHSCYKNWRERLFQKLFTFEETKNGLSTSHFVNHTTFCSPPRSDSIILRHLDDVIVQIPKQVTATATIHPGSLHHLVWLGVQGMRHSSPVPQRMPLPPADFHTQQLFAALALTECSGGNANDTVNRLDVDSFLYAAVLCAGAQLCSEIVSGFYSSDRPITLPADITCQLCTPEQANWWSAVHKIYSKQMTSRTIVDSKWDLLRGVEVIRAIGNHGLDPILLAALAQTFTERALSFYTSPLNSSSSTVDYISPKLDLSAAVHHNPEMAALESRANLYWKAALPLLERMRQGKAMTNPTSRLFHFHRDQVDATTLNTLIEEGNLFVARQLMTNEDYEEAVEAFKSLRSPYASYHTAEVYLKLAADNNMVDSVMSLQGGSSVRDSMLKEKRARQTGLLEKARDALYVTRDRLHSDQQHPLHRVLPERIKYVESRLDDTEEFLSPSGSPFAVGGGSQTEMNGSAGRSQRQLTYLSTSTPRNIKVNNSSPRTQAVTAQPAVAALGPDIENLLQASETRLQDAFKSANTVMAERLESIVDTIMSKLTRLEVSVDEIRRDVAKLQHPDDLYMLGDDDEDYADDVLSFPAASYVTSQPPAPQPQPPAAAAAAAAYYGAGVVAAAAPSRGVHGTATVTYGAPAAAQPPLPPAPSQPPQYYSPQYHHNSPVAAQAAAQHAAAAASIGYYGQGALPFSEGQQLPDFLRPAVAPTAAGIGAGGKLPSSIPVNVVITSSDTLPTGPPPVLPMLSVTIPPKHRLGGGGVVTMSAPPPQTAPPIVNPPTAIINSHQSSVISSDAVAVGAHEFQIAMPATANIPSLLHNPPLAALLQHQDDEQLESRTASPTDLEEHDPYPDFKPIIPLPDEVLPTTGEEGEHVLFENRAKLYRFVDKEWKERGIGQLKLLEDRSSKKIRLLMRREQVHKICANHYLTRDMTLNPMPGAASDKAWLWSANDYAEQKLQQEQFCVKFKTADEAANFKEAFEAAQLTLSESANCSSSSIRDEESILRSATNLSTSSSTSTPILSKTSGATVSSPSSKITLGGFTFTSTPTVKPTDEKSGGGSVASAAANKQQAVVPTTAAPANPFNAFAFTFSPKSSTAAPTINILKTPIFTTPTGPQLFLNKSSSSTTTTTTTTTTSKPTTEAAVKGDMLLKSALKSSSSLPKTVQIEGVENNVKVTSQLRRPHMSVQELVSSDAAAATPTFIEKSSGAVDFAALAKSAATTAVGGGFKKSETFKGFEGSGSLVFGGGSKGVAGDDDGGEEGGEEFVPTAEFRPVIALPALVAVRTGEEEERVLYEQRAKLLRFDPEAREWKERGVGKMKILHNASNGTVRFLMRREQVLKVCCNHRVTADFKMELSSNSDRAYTWYALDYSEATPTREMFALRFKTAEQAADFRAAVDDALELVNTSLGLSEVSSGDVTANSSCVTEGGSSGDEGGSWPGPVKITELHSVTTKTSKHQQPSLKEMFKPKAGSWECTGCLVRNNADIKKCPACGTMKEVTPSQSASKQPPPTSKQQPQSSTTSKTSSQPSLSEMFKPKAGSWECQGCLVRNNAEVKQCPACGTWKDGEQADSSSAAQSTTKSTLTFGSNVFGTSPAAASTGFSFGIPPAATSSTDKLSSTGTTAFSFGTPAAVSATQSSTKFSFGSMFASSNTSSAQSVVSNIFGVTSGGEKEGEDSKTAVFGDVSSTKPQETSGSIFGGVPSTNKPQESDVGSIFGGANSQSAAKTNFSFGGGSSAAAFVFQGQGDASKKFEFNFSGLQHPKSPPATAESDDSEADGEDGHDESNDSIHFHPVIPLPDQVPVTTGEEEESALYTHRAKLFRFMEGEWKERGIGDVKILKHNATGKLRLLMRREIVLKVCLNHFLTAELTFQPKDEKTWLWCAIDYSEGEVLKEKFALRFKTAEIAKEFKDAVDAALAGFKDVPEEKTIDTSLSAVMNSFSFSLPTNQSTPPPSTNTTPFSFSSKGESSSGGGGSTTNKSIFGGSATTVGKADSDDDVQVVYETVVTPEEREAALSLQLPPTFYAYKQAPPCPGCIGCEPEEDEEKEDGGGLEKSASLVGKTSEKSIFQSPAASGAGKTSSKSSPLAASVLNVADSTSVGVGAPSFSFKFAESAASPAAGGLFGGKASTETLSSATPIFGAGAGGLFGKSSSTTTTSATPIFGGTAFGKSTSSENPPSSATPIFGATTFGKSTSSENPPSSATPIFGATTFGKSTSSENPPSSATPIFGGTAFGKSASSENPPSSATPIFGATTFGKSASSENPSSTPNSIFGSSGTAVFGGAAKSSATSWGTTAATGMLFGSPASNNSSNNNNNKQETTAQNNNSSSSNGPGFLFKEAMSFSSLASAGSGDGEGVGGAGGLKKAPENFKWGTAQPVFGSLKKKTNNSEENEEEEDAGGDEEEEVVNSEDIHFEPVVPMPPLIEVKTGEEDEEKVFGERAKLYRFDADLKEWKERGVGEMKILHHPAKRTYRLLLRRELVHKVVCNHLITGDMELGPMATSNQAFAWTAMNLAEEYQAPQLEQLAVRFKNVDLALAFKAKMDQCTAQVKAIKLAQREEKVQMKKNGQNSGSPTKEQRLLSSYEREEYDDEEDEDYDEDDDEDDDDDDDNDDDDENDYEDNTIDDAK